MTEGIVWVVDGNYVRPVRVRVGASDGTMTEVRGEGLREGLQVVIAAQTQTGSAPATSNPFAPQFPSRGRPQGSRP